MVVEPKLPQDKRTSQPGPQRSVVDLHLWQITPIRDAFWIGLGVAVLLFTYYLRSIFTPVLIGLLLAYIFNPMICYFEERWRIPRPITISALLVLLVALLIILSVWVIPMLIGETFSLLRNIPGYLRTLIGELEQKHIVRPGTLEGIRSLTTLPQGSPQDMMQTLLDWTSQAFGYLGTVIETSTYVILTMILIPIYFFSFAWQFEPILRRAREYIPPRHRERTLNILRQMDNAVSGFFRGRLIVAFVMSAVFMLGWKLANVPYWFLLGIVAAILNIVPYLVVVVWPLAILLKWLNISAAAGAVASTKAAASATVGAVAAATQALATQPAATQAATSQATGMSWDWLYLAIGPTIAYLVAQFLDNWLITPIIQSRSSNLTAVTIMIVVLVGGAVGGLYGLLLAIPVASCAKILAKEVLIPHLQKWAQEE